jgi:peptide/nickel transport system permease protein
MSEQQKQAEADPLIDEPNWLKDKIVRFLDSDVYFSFKRSPVTIVAFTVLVVLVLGAVVGPYLAPQNPHDPGQLNLMDGFTAPMTDNAFTGNYFFLGSDDQGRDIFSAILYGLRISLFVGVVSVLFAGILGVTLGLISGYFGGWIDVLIMRIADIQLTFPSILIAMLIYGIARGLVPVEMRDQAALYILILSIGLSEWVQFARTVRGATLVEREREYVQAARLIGLGRFPIMIRHVLPNVMGPVLVIGTIGLALAIIAEATLSFLGVGAPPTTPSLGTLIRIGQDFLFSGEWWIILFPSVTLLVLALAVNLLGDWLRDVLNPKLR